MARIRKLSDPVKKLVVFERREHKQLRRLAQTLGRSMSEVLRLAFREFAYKQEVKDKMVKKLEKCKDDAEAQRLLGELALVDFETARALALEMNTISRLKQAVKGGMRGVRKITSGAHKDPFAVRGGGIVSR